MKLIAPDWFLDQIQCFWVKSYITQMFQFASYSYIIFQDFWRSYVFNLPKSCLIRNSLSNKNLDDVKISVSKNIKVTTLKNSVHARKAGSWMHGSVA